MRKLLFKQVSRNKIKVSSCNCCLFDILLQGIGLHANLRGRIIDLNPHFFNYPSMVHAARIMYLSQAQAVYQGTTFY